MEDGLRIFVIYDSPRDFPGKYVVREQRADRSGVSVAAAPLAVVDTLGEARRAVPPGLFRIVRDPSDDPVIVESWI